MRRDGELVRRAGSLSGQSLTPTIRPMAPGHIMGRLDRRVGPDEREVRGRNLVYGPSSFSRRHADSRRMTFFNLEDGRVRQFVEQSIDEGQTWTPQIELSYARTRLLHDVRPQFLRDVVGADQRIRVRIGRSPSSACATSNRSKQVAMMRRKDRDLQRMLVLDRERAGRRAPRPRGDKPDAAARTVGAFPARA